MKKGILAAVMALTLCMGSMTAYAHGGNHGGNNHRARQEECTADHAADCQLGADCQKHCTVSQSSSSSSAPVIQTTTNTTTVKNTTSTVKAGCIERQTDHGHKHCGR